MQSTFKPPVSLHEISQIYTRGIYIIYVRIHTWEILTRKRKQHPYQGDDASTGWVDPDRVVRDAQGEARRANTTPNGGTHLELERLPLKTWSKSDFSIAETTWPAYLYIHLYIKNYSRRLPTKFNVEDVVSVFKIRNRFPK